jgi:hypothetical protein
VLWKHTSSAREGVAGGLADLNTCGVSGKKAITRISRGNCWEKTTWPSEYWCKAPLIDKATQEEHMYEIPCLLPHEVIQHLVELDSEKMKQFVP